MTSAAVPIRSADDFRIMSSTIRRNSASTWGTSWESGGGISVSCRCAFSLRVPPGNGTWPVRAKYSVQPRP
jgi:hypothetical protein